MPGSWGGGRTAGKGAPGCSLVSLRFAQDSSLLAANWPYSLRFQDNFLGISGTESTSI